jgi:retinol-binding protein 3
MARTWSLVGCAVLVLLAGVLTAQAPPPGQDITLDAATRAEVVDGVLKALNEGYIFPDVAKKMEEAIRARQQRKEYDAISSPRLLAQTLTDHLREVSKDKHLGVNYSPQVLPPLPPPPKPDARPSPEDQARFEQQNANAARQNFGFVKIERLAGNIGYLDFRAFMPPAVAGDTAAAAMTFLASCDAVIFDMRQNGGGDPAMVAFVTSYLFGSQPVHLNDFYNRITNETRQSWTLPYVPGKRITNKDVYILTSSRTFSGAEEFTYNLKHLKRATVVGETTGGGAHLVGPRRINDHFVIGVPSGRPINAVTKTDWEGVGVEPDVKVSADLALKTAHLMALEKQEKALPVDAKGLKSEVATAIQNLKSELAASGAPSVTAIDNAPPLPASRASDDFESGKLSNWKIDRSGAGSWFVYSNGKTAPEPAQSDANVPFNVPDPPQGKFALVTDMNGPGRRILYRDIMLDGRYRLHLTVFYVNEGASFSDLGALNQSTIGDDQQYRIDLVAPSAPVASVTKDHVLANVFRTGPGEPRSRQPTPITVDLSPWQGQTVRLRLASADNAGPMHAGVDNIRLEAIGK